MFHNGFKRWIDCFQSVPGSLRGSSPLSATKFLSGGSFVIDYNILCYLFIYSVLRTHFFGLKDVMSVKVGFKYFVGYIYI